MALFAARLMELLPCYACIHAPLRRPPHFHPNSHLSPSYYAAAASSQLDLLASHCGPTRGLCSVIERELGSELVHAEAGNHFMLRAARPIDLLGFYRIVRAQAALNPLSPRQLCQFTAMDMDRERKKAAGQARLLSKPPNPNEHRGTIAGPKRGVLPLNLSGGRRDGLLYIPSSYSVEKPSPVALVLHGAGGHAQGALQLISDYAEGHNLILVAPESRGRTWDMIIDAYGPDVEFIDRSLAKVFQEYTVDPTHLAIAGFSDGASYSISLGVCNGFLFTHIIGFSPGFMRVQRYEDSPLIYVSHGTGDAVLRIDNCSRRVVPRLQQQQYRVTYHEFEGGHTVPASIAAEALKWFLQTNDDH